MLISAVLLVVVLVATIRLITPEPDRERHTFTTHDGTTVEWIGDACMVLDDGRVLVCTERA